MHRTEIEVIARNAAFVVGRDHANRGISGEDFRPETLLHLTAVQTATDKRVDSTIEEVRWVLDQSPGVFTDSYRRGRLSI